MTRALLFACVVLSACERRPIVRDVGPRVVSNAAGMQTLSLTGERFSKPFAVTLKTSRGSLALEAMPLDESEATLA
ncbi:MAG: hypothetical protein IT381_05100, partial [Deltaproteobacteria bacterium]|nr:hypothetical protein [Deltaproteobacteria bacterium]